MAVIVLIFLMLSALGCGFILQERFKGELDDAESTALGGSMVLCATGWLIGVTGNWTLTIAPLAIPLAGVGLLLFVIKRRSFSILPNPTKWWLAWGLLLAFPLLKAISPSDMLDWDTLAYHFAVPKMWLEVGRMTFIPFIHQSNFPGIVDNLFIEGLRFGESVAKSITVFYWILGGLWVFGVTRRLFGAVAAPWAALAFLSTPLILWSSGSGYIDVAHGLFAAMGMMYAAESVRHSEIGKWLLLSGFGLGAAMGSKYTGLQVALVALLVLSVLITQSSRWREATKPLILASALALLIACPWYIRTYANTGNPVFPFFFEQLGGRGWDQWRADIYRNEQQSFGVGRTERGRDLSAIGASVLGLAYQPGRYINPEPSEGGGAPMGALGFALLLGPLAWLCFGARSGPVMPLLVMSGLLLMMFFLLSQQVRYVTSLAPLWAIMLAGIGVPRWREILRVAVAVQAVYTGWLLWITQAENQFKVLTGVFPRDAYQRAVVPFSAAAETINREVGKQGKLALYNEVFGYFLDIKYVWANPGHSMIIPYDDMQTGPEFASGLSKLGFTHAYLATRDLSRDQRELLALALQGKPVPADVAASMDSNLDRKWFRLQCDAIASRSLVPIPLPEGAPGLLLKNQSK